MGSRAARPLPRKETHLRRYEAMFLFDPAATRDWAAVEQEVRRLCERAGAQLLVCVKYDERRLAYEIKRRKRGTYALAYFEAPPDRIPELERDAQLSELLLRVLILKADHLTEEKLAELKAHPPEVALSPAGEGRRHDDDRHGGERHGDRHGERRGPRREEAVDATGGVGETSPEEVPAPVAEGDFGDEVR